MPHVVLVDRHHVEAAVPEAPEAALIASSVDDARVVQLALHLEDHGQAVGDEVDSADPCSAAPQIDLATELREAGSPQDLHHSRFESAGRGDVVHAADREDLTHHADPRSTPLSELVQHAVQRCTADKVHRPRRVDHSLHALDPPRKLGSSPTPPGDLEQGTSGHHRGHPPMRHQVVGREQHALVAGELPFGPPNVASPPVDLPRLERVAGDAEPRKGCGARECGTRSTIENRGHRALLERDGGTSESDDSGCGLLPASARHQPAPSGAGDLKLMRSDHTVLVRRQPSNV
jgi:hypothetical protein